MTVDPILSRPEALSASEWWGLLALLSMLYLVWRLTLGRSK